VSWAGAAGEGPAQGPQAAGGEGRAERARSGAAAGRLRPRAMHGVGDLPPLALYGAACRSRPLCHVGRTSGASA
jgi:hypothetical protein